MSLIYIPNPIPTISSHDQLNKLLTKDLKSIVFNWEWELKTEHVVTIENLRQQLTTYLDTLQDQEITLVLDAFASFVYYAIAPKYTNVKKIIILNPMFKKVWRKRINIKNTLLPTSMTNTIYKYMYLFKSLDCVRNDLDWLSSIREEQVLIDDKELMLHKLIDQLLNNKVIKQHDKWLHTLTQAHFISGSHNLLSPVVYLKQQIPPQQLSIITDCGFNLIWEQKQKFNELLLGLTQPQKQTIAYTEKAVKQAFFPGSFNPFHEGHLNIIQQALAHDFDLVHIVIAQNPDKTTNDFETNYTMITKVLEQANLTAQVKVIIEHGNVPLLAKQMGVQHIIRGYRNDKDWTFEQQLKELYLQYNPLLKFKLYLADKKYQKVSSTKHK